MYTKLNLTNIIVQFLSTGGWKGTRLIHDHLKERGIKVSRKCLINILNNVAERGEYVSIGGIRQMSWITPPEPPTRNR